MTKTVTCKNYAWNLAGDLRLPPGFSPERGVQVATPMMGERVDMQAPQPGERWWQAPERA